MFIFKLHYILALIIYVQRASCLQPNALPGDTALFNSSQVESAGSFTDNLYNKYIT